MCSRSHFHIAWQDEKSICRVEDDNNKQKAQARGNEALHLRCYELLLRIVMLAAAYLISHSHDMMPLVFFRSRPLLVPRRPHQNNPDFSDESASKPASFRANSTPLAVCATVLVTLFQASGARYALIQRDRVGLRLRRSVTPLPTVPSRPSAALFVGRRTIADSTPALCYT